MDRVDEILDEMLGTIGQAADGWRQADILLRPFAERIATLESQLAAREGEVKHANQAVSIAREDSTRAARDVVDGWRCWREHDRRLDQVEMALCDLAQIATDHVNMTAARHPVAIRGPLGDIARQLASRAEEK